MPDSLSTVRLALPLMAAGQAQKEVTHNEALALIDGCIAPLVEAVELTAPPAEPVAGQQWIVGPAAEGAWSGEDGKLAWWSGAGWRFVALPPGAQVTERSGLRQWRQTAGGWTAPASVAAPSGGGLIDSECRTQLAAVIAALVAAGLLSG